MVAVVEDTALIGLSDDEILAAATTAGRALVTANIRDFVPLDRRYKASGKAHAGLVLVSAKAFDRSLIGALIGALEKLLGEGSLRVDAIVFLSRGSEITRRPSPRYGRA